MEDVTSSHGAPLPSSSQPGMLEKWSSFSCIPAGRGPAAEQVGAGRAVCPRAQQLFDKGSERRGGMLGPRGFWGLRLAACEE